MRRSTLLTCLFLAALGGGVTARLITPSAQDPTPGRDMLESATAAALPAPALAATPAPPTNGAVPTLAPMLARVTPGVVNIYSRKAGARTRVAQYYCAMGFAQFCEQKSLGSGVIVDATRGLILTNNHVIEGADEVSVTLSDGRSFEAQPIGSDGDTDVAVIRIEATGLQAIPLADSASLRVGDYVVAVGNPFGLGQTVTSGIVSAVGRTGIAGLGYQNFIQTDASINPGNSGGALVDLHGRLVGINAASYNPQGSSAGNIGLGFAIPANLAREVMRQLMAYGEVRRGSLGVDSRDVNAEVARQFDLDANARGALVARVYRGSPAETAGLRPGDLITSANGQRIASAQDLHNLEGLLPVGQPVRLEVQRDGRAQILSATLKAQPREIDGGQVDPRLAGASIAELPERSRQQGVRGVVITKVTPGSRAARNNLDGGDVVLGVNRRAIADLREFRDQLSARPPILVLVLQRGGARGELRMQ
jgi:serine protease DegQ